MKSKILNLIAKWDEFIETIKEERRMSKGNMVNYQSLMVETYKCVREECTDKKVSKELCFLFVSLGAFTSIGWDEDGNCIYEGYFEAVSMFHCFFLSSLQKNNFEFVFDEEGLLVINGVEDEIIKVNPKTFKIPEDILA